MQGLSGGWNILNSYEVLLKLISRHRSVVVEAGGEVLAALCGALAKHDVPFLGRRHVRITWTVF